MTTAIISHVKALLENITGSRQDTEEKGKISWGISWQAPIPKPIAYCMWTERTTADSQRTQAASRVFQAEALTPFLSADLGNIPETAL